MSAPVETRDGNLILDSHKLSYHMDEGYSVTVQPDGGTAFTVPPAWVLEHLTQRRPAVVEIVGSHA